MNWLFTILFFIFIYFQYMLVGTAIRTWTGYTNNKSITFLIGYIVTFFVLWVSGLFSQLLKSSWSFYFISSIILVIFTDLFLALFLYKRKGLKKKIWEINIKEFITNNWAGIVFVIIFTILSMSNELPFLQANYDDYYYIGKMVNLVDSPMLLNEDYYNGSLIISNNFDIIRIINTYELSYSFFAHCFNIYIPFFCRVTMTFHNYFLVYLVFKNLSSFEVKKSLAQFCILPFFIFLIPMGYLQNGLTDYGVGICSYDLWQFQTAMFYGGSIVRTLGFPFLFLFSFPLLNRMDWKKIVFVGILSCTLVSFSTIFMQQFILFVLVIFVLKGITDIKKGIESKDKVKIIAGLLFFIVDIFAIFFIYYNNPWNIAINEKQKALYLSLYNMNQLWYSDDLILKYTLIPVLILLIIAKKYKQKILSMFVLILYAIIRVPKLQGLLLRTCFEYDFVAFRTIASVQYLMLFTSFLLILYLIQYIRKEVIVTYGLSFLIIIGSISFFGLHLKDYPQYEYLGSGISKDGWNFRRIFNLNTPMVPEFAYEIGEYFNGLPYGNYRFYTSTVYKENQKNVDIVTFLMTSNRIETRNRNGFSTSDNNYEIIDSVLYDGNLENYEQALELMKELNIEYALIDDEMVYSLLIENDAELIEVYNEEDDPFYFVKMKY